MAESDKNENIDNTEHKTIESTNEFEMNRNNIPNKIENDLENTSELNNTEKDLHPQISEDHLQKQNKIKLNQQALRNSLSNIQNISSTQDSTIINSSNNDTSFYQSRLYKYPLLKKFNCTVKTKKIIVEILLILSAILLICSIIDLIKFIGNKGNNKINDYILKNEYLFLLEILIISVIIFYQLINYFIKPKKTPLVLLVITFIFLFIAIIRVITFASKKVSVLNFCFNFGYLVVMVAQESLTLFLLIIDEKKHKNTMQNIEEIINFHEVNSTSKKSISELKSNKVDNGENGDKNKVKLAEEEH